MTVPKHHSNLPNRILFLILLHLLPHSTLPSAAEHPNPPPLPLPPLPTALQLSWQLSEMAMFFHFGPNTFTGSEWGTGQADPSLFNPASLNATQWVSVAKENGFSRVVLTAKHHDGFCLWPSKYGEITQIFLDGAKGEGEKDMEYYFDHWFSFIHQYQPGAAIFSEAGPDTRWVGNEAGIAPTTCWSLFNCSDAIIGGTDIQYLGHGDPVGHDWVPAECDVSIRPGWFWHASEIPKTAMDLLDIYYKSVGRNCLLLLNVPPNTSGLISDEDIQVLREFTEIRTSIFSHNLAKHAYPSASSTRGATDSHFAPENVLKEGIYTYWAPGRDQSKHVLYLDFQEQYTFNVFEIKEPIHMGQRIIAFHIDILNERMEWEETESGSTIGYRRFLLFPTVKTNSIRLVIDKCREEPLISYVGLYLDQFSFVAHQYINKSNMVWFATF